MAQLEIAHARGLRTAPVHGACRVGLQAARSRPDLETYPAATCRATWIGNLTVDHVHGQRGFVRQDSALLQQQSVISGFYRSWSGDKSCADFNLGGWVVRARMGSQTLAMHVRMEDGSSCFFRGYSA